MGCGAKTESTSEGFDTSKEITVITRENGYNDTLTLDRIDNSKGYCPDNCRFVTYAQNNQNRRDNKLLEFNGEVHCVTEWGRITGIGQSVLSNRLKRGWSVEKAFQTPTKEAVK